MRIVADYHDAQGLDPYHDLVEGLRLLVRGGGDGYDDDGGGVAVAVAFAAVVGVPSFEFHPC